MNSVTSLQRREGACVDEADESPPKGTLASIAERASRLAAQVKYDALAAGGLVGPVDCEKNRDPDRCGTERVSRPVLFDEQAGDIDPVDGPDVRQAELNDCHLMAPLAALASTPEGRAFIKNAVHENKNDKGEVVSYTVTLHEPRTHLWGPTTFSEVKFTVDDRFDPKHAEARVSERGHEIWSLLIEKAFAQYCGGHSKIDAHGSPARAMEIVTGRPAVDIPLATAPGYSAARLQCDLAAGKLVVLLTKPSFDGQAPRDVVPGHAYHFSEAKLEGGKLVVVLHNPWTSGDPGRAREPSSIPYDDIQRWFAAVDVGSVR